MNTAILMTLSYNMGIGFVVPVDWFKPDVEDIVSTYRLFSRGGGTNFEGENGSSPLPGWMGMDPVNKMVGIRKSQKDLSEV